MSREGNRQEQLDLKTAIVQLKSNVEYYLKQNPQITDHYRVDLENFLQEQVNYIVGVAASNPGSDLKAYYLDSITQLIKFEGEVTQITTTLSNVIDQLRQNIKEYLEQHPQITDHQRTDLESFLQEQINYQTQTANSSPGALEISFSQSLESLEKFQNDLTPLIQEVESKKFEEELEDRAKGLIGHLNVGEQIISSIGAIFKTANDYRRLSEEHISKANDKELTKLLHSFEDSICAAIIEKAEGFLRKPRSERGSEESMKAELETELTRVAQKYENELKEILGQLTDLATESTKKEIRDFVEEMRKTASKSFKELKESFKGEPGAKEALREVRSGLEKKLKETKKFLKTPKVGQNLKSRLKEARKDWQEHLSGTKLMLQVKKELAGHHKSRAIKAMDGNLKQFLKEINSIRHENGLNEDDIELIEEILRTNLQEFRKRIEDSEFIGNALRDLLKGSVEGWTDRLRNAAYAVESVQKHDYKLDLFMNMHQEYFDENLDHDLQEALRQKIENQIIFSLIQGKVDPADMEGKIDEAVANLLTEPAAPERLVKAIKFSTQSLDHLDETLEKIEGIDEILIHQARPRIQEKLQKTTRRLFEIAGSPKFEEEFAKAQKYMDDLPETLTKFAELQENLEDDVKRLTKIIEVTLENKMEGEMNSRTREYLRTLKTYVIEKIKDKFNDTLTELLESPNPEKSLDEIFAEREEVMIKFLTQLQEGAVEAIKQYSPTAQSSSDQNFAAGISSAMSFSGSMPYIAPENPTFDQGIAQGTSISQVTPLISLVIGGVIAGLAHTVSEVSRMRSEKGGEIEDEFHDAVEPPKDPKDEGIESDSERGSPSTSPSLSRKAAEKLTPNKTQIQIP